MGGKKFHVHIAYVHSWKVGLHLVHSSTNLALINQQAMSGTIKENVVLEVSLWWLVLRESLHNIFTVYVL